MSYDASLDDRDFAEHVTAVTVSVKDKLTLSLGVAVGSSIVSHPLSYCVNVQPS